MTDRPTGTEREDDEFEEALDALDPEPKSADEIADEATPPADGPAASGSLPG